MHYLYTTYPPRPAHCGAPFGAPTRTCLRSPSLPRRCSDLDRSQLLAAAGRGPGALSTLTSDGIGALSHGCRRTPYPVSSLSVSLPSTISTVTATMAMAISTNSITRSQAGPLKHCYGCPLQRAVIKCHGITMAILTPAAAPQTGWHMGLHVYRCMRPKRAECVVPL